MWVYIISRKATRAFLCTFLLAVGLMVGLIGTGILNDLLIPAYVLFAVAIPFLVVYARNPRQLWALIVGGITAVIGLSFLVAEALVEYVVPAVLILAGIWILARQFIRQEEKEAGNEILEP